MKEQVSNMLNFEADFFVAHPKSSIMADKKIEKKAYGVFQDAILEKQQDGSYKPLDMAREGMTTLKKHATQVIVICTDSSTDDVEDMLKKNEIPFDKVIKLDDRLDFIVTGKDNAVHTYSWPGALDDIGYKLSREQKVEKKSDQQKSDSALEHWFKKESEKCGCIASDY